MPELSLNDIDRISRDIRREEISFSHLLEDLIDHVCCDVEYEMETGLSFNEAYNRVKKKMGSRRLKEIQEETLYAIDSKYRKMKTTMKIAGIAGTVMLGFASLFKIQHWPGAGPLMTLGAFTLAFLFMPSALAVLWKETHNRKKLFLFISAFFAAVLFILGTLFKIQHWPGAGWLLTLAAFSGIFLFLPAILAHLLSDPERKNRRGAYILGTAAFILYSCGMLFKIQHWPLATILMVTGLIILGAVALPWYVYLKWKDENNITSGFLFIILGLLLIIIPGMMINMNLRYAYEDGYFPHLYRQQEMYRYLKSNNEAFLAQYHDSVNYTKLEKIHSATASVLTSITNIEIKMVQEAEGEPGIPATITYQVKQGNAGPEIQYGMLKRPYHIAPYADFLMPGTASRQELDRVIADYRDIISAPLKDEGSRKYLDLLNTSVYFPAETKTRLDMSLLSAMHSLELLKNSLLTVELQALTSIASAR
jgi:hypothetical protein